MDNVQIYNSRYVFVFMKHQFPLPSNFPRIYELIVFFIVYYTQQKKLYDELS